MQAFRKKITSIAFLFLVLPASTNYSLRDYGVGSGGEGNAASTNYAMQAIIGETSGLKLSGATYDLGPGLVYTQQAHVPGAPTFQNTGSDYNKLRFILNTANNPSDTRYAIAISDDNFVTTNFVQSDNTVGSTLGVEDYQTYASWGGASGAFIIGLSANTTYTMKVKVMQGAFSETAYGPSATAATVTPSLSFDIDVAPTDSDTEPPFSVAMGQLLANTIVDSANKIWIDFATNGTTGGRVYIVAEHGGLYSPSQSYTIASSTENLSSSTEGFGAQTSSVTQASGGPLTSFSPYDGASEVVGVTDTTIRPIFSTDNPLTGGRGSFVLKAKSSATTPAAADYEEALTIIATASF